MCGGLSTPGPGWVRGPGGRGRRAAGSAGAKRNGHVWAIVGRARGPFFFFPFPHGASPVPRPTCTPAPRPRTPTPSPPSTPVQAARVLPLGPALPPPPRLLRSGRGGRGGSRPPRARTQAQAGPRRGRAMSSGSRQMSAAPGASCRPKARARTKTTLGRRGVWAPGARPSPTPTPPHPLVPGSARRKNIVPPATRTHSSSKEDSPFFFAAADCHPPSRPARQPPHPSREFYMSQAMRWWGRVHGWGAGRARVRAGRV